MSRNMDRKSMIEVLKVLRTAFDLSGPLYIGITARQSLLDRLNQHLSGDSAVYPGLESAGLSWDEIYFSWIEIDVLNSESLRSCEKLLQNVFKPLFCKA